MGRGRKGESETSVGDRQSGMVQAGYTLTPANGQRRTRTGVLGELRALGGPRNLGVRPNAGVATRLDVCCRPLTANSIAQTGARGPEF